MEENKNELQSMEEVDTNTGEIVQNNSQREQIIEETENYVTVKLADGTFKRKAKYHEFSSFQPETREDKLWLFSLIDGEEEVGQGMAENVGEHVEIQDIITKTYSTIDEKTGEEIHGVLTYLITPDRKAYVTSSKGVYFSIMNLMDLFGTPNDELWENITVEILSERTQNGTAIKLKMIK